MCVCVFHVDDVSRDTLPRCIIKANAHEYEQNEICCFGKAQGNCNILARQCSTSDSFFFLRYACFVAIKSDAGKNYTHIENGNI